MSADCRPSELEPCLLYTPLPQLHDIHSRRLISDFDIYVETDSTAPPGSSGEYPQGAPTPSPSPSPSATLKGGSKVPKAAWIEYLHLCLSLRKENPHDFWSWYNTTSSPCDLFLSQIEPSSSSTSNILQSSPFDSIKSIRVFERKRPLLVENCNTGGRFKIVYNISDASNREHFDNLWLNILLFMISCSNMDKNVSLTGLVTKPQTRAGRNLNNGNLCLELWFSRDIYYASFDININSNCNSNSNSTSSCSNIESKNTLKDASGAAVTFSSINDRHDTLSSSNESGNDEIENKSVYQDSLASLSIDDRSIVSTGGIENSDTSNTKGNNALANNDSVLLAEDNDNIQIIEESAAVVTPRRPYFESMSAARKWLLLLQQINVSTNLIPVKVEFEKFQNKA